MTNNGGGRSANFDSVVYDSGHQTSGGRKRIGISATEIELLDDIPPSSGRSVTNSANPTREFDTQMSNSSTTKQNNYQTLSVNREQPKPNVVYHDGTNQQLNSALDQLLEKYAPDAIPQNLINGSNNRSGPGVINVVTTRDQPPVSIFQTTTPPPSTASHNYSTIIRPNTGQMPPASTQMNNNNNNNSGVRSEQPPTYSRPTTNYDSFQHVIPPVQQQQSQRSVPIKTKNGHHAKVVPGKLYNLDDDPLHLLYDRQPSAPFNPQQPNFTTTFQPSNNFQSPPNLSHVIYANTTQQYPQQSIPISTNPNVNGLQQFDLGELIKRVQQDYLREIQPFVSSVKFVEKDREYGQSLADVGFVTPVTVRKGFRSQADDILRRSFGRQDRSRPVPTNQDDYNTYSEEEEDDDIDDLRPSYRRRSLEKMDSKQSFTSVTSVSTISSDFDEHYQSAKNRKDHVQSHNQGTSPPPQVNETKPSPAQVQKSAAIPLGVTPKSNTKDESNKEETSSRKSPAVVVKPARRLASDEISDTISESTISDNEEKYPATYNEHELPRNASSQASPGLNILPALVPGVKPNESSRERLSNTPNQGAKRSEDIHPTPPTIRPAQTNTTGAKNNRPSLNNLSDASDASRSESGDLTGSDSEGPPTGNKAQPPASSTTRPGVPSATPTARNPAVPITTTTQNQLSTPRTNSTNNAKLSPGSGTNPNTPSDQRSNIADRVGPLTSQSTSTPGTTQTGSNRFFQSDNTPKSGAKQGNKSGPSSIGERLKTIFRRK